jgi:hypothetical protein
MPAAVLPAQTEQVAQVPQYHGVSQYPQNPHWHVPHVPHGGGVSAVPQVEQ